MLEDSEISRNFLWPIDVYDDRMIEGGSMMTRPLMHPMSSLLVVVLAIFWVVVYPASAAEPFAAEPVRYPAVTVAEPGSRVLLYFELKNTGTASWPPGSVALTNIRNPMGAAQQYTANRSVLPNETVYWDFEVSAPRLAGIHEGTWQLRYGSQAISPLMTTYVVVVPKEANELRAKIQKLIDEFNAQHGQDVKQLIRQIAELFAKEGKGIIERLLAGRCAPLSGLLAVAAMTVAVRRRTPL